MFNWLVNTLADLGTWVGTTCKAVFWFLLGPLWSTWADDRWAVDHRLEWLLVLLFIVILLQRVIWHSRPVLLAWGRHKKDSEPRYPEWLQRTAGLRRWAVIFLVGYVLLLIGYAVRPLHRSIGTLFYYVLPVSIWNDDYGYNVAPWWWVLAMALCLLGLAMALIYSRSILLAWLRARRSNKLAKQGKAYSIAQIPSRGEAGWACVWVALIFITPLLHAVNVEMIRRERDQAINERWAHKHSVPTLSGRR